MSVIGVFDSGVGGLSVANAIRDALPQHEIILREDKENLPYGNKTPDELFRLVVPIFAEMIGVGCDIIVVACNTVSTTLIGRIRERFPEMTFVAIEPMVKPAAALTKSGVIAVCATPTTLASPRYAQLKQTYANDVEVLEPDCSDWAYMIQHNQVEVAEIAKRIRQVLKNGADVIVLACTHYHWIEQEINRLAEGRAQVIQPESAIISRVKTLLTEVGGQATGR
jgi:glutamate racemase